VFGSQPLSDEYGAHHFGVNGAVDPLTGKTQGSGLGLYISRRIIEHSGGRLWVTSRPGQGACFSFTLPLVNEAALGKAA